MCGKDKYGIPLKSWRDIPIRHANVPMKVLSITEKVQTPYGEMVGVLLEVSSGDSLKARFRTDEDKKLSFFNQEHSFIAVWLETSLKLKLGDLITISSSDGVSMFKH